MPTDPLQLARLGALKATDAPSQLPSGILPGTSSKGASWITSLTKPFDAYFRNYQIRQQQEFALKAQEQQGQQALQLEKAKTQNIYLVAIGLVATAVVLGAFK
jgi:hypothetical protein